jgi:hypothetical protein
MSNPFEPIPVTNTLRPIAFGFDVPFWGHGGEGSRMTQLEQTLVPATPNIHTPLRATRVDCKAS